MLNLLYAGNKGVFDGLFISLLSIAKKTKEPMTAYILTMDLTDINPKFTAITASQIDIIEANLKKYNPAHRLVLKNCREIFLEGMAGSPNLNNAYTPYTLLRLNADQLDLPSPILYLDTDTVSNKDISEIFEFDVTKYELAGAIDYLGQWFLGNYYINAGVLLLNLDKIKETGLFQGCREMCRTKKLAFSDQTAINKLVKYKGFLPRKYNEQRIYKEETVIQHFCKSIRWFPYHTVNAKPWHLERFHKVHKVHVYDDVILECLAVKKENNL